MTKDTVPLLRGKKPLDLRGSRPANSRDTPDWLIIKCPSCNSDNVVSVDPAFNPVECWVETLRMSTRGLWFCPSCQENWRYGYPLVGVK